MPPDESEEQSCPSKRSRRSLSRNRSPREDVVDLTESSEAGSGSSRKHERHEKGSQLEGPTKRAKREMDSEPTARKDTSMTPNAKRKKLEKKINHRKASHTSGRPKLKESVGTFESGLVEDPQARLDWQAGQERDLTNSNQVHNDSNQSGTLNVDLDTAELKHLRKLRDEQSEEIKRLQLIINRSYEEVESLTDRVDNPFTGLRAFQLSSQRKDVELNSKNEELAAKNKDLYDKTSEAALYKHQRDELKLSFSTANNEIEAMKGNLTRTEREHARDKERLQESVQEVEDLRNINDKNGSWNEKLKQQASRAKDTLAKERNEYKKTIAALKAEKVELQQEGAQLNTKLNNQKNKYNEMITRLQTQLRDSRPQSQRFNFKVPDEKVKQDFAALDSKIRQFVDKYTRPPLKTTDQELQAVWPSWSPKIRKFLASPFLCNLVFEGYIWERLLGRVFTPWSEVWAGDLGPSLEQALCIAGEEAESKGFKSEFYTNYQYWRSSSSSLIGQIDGEKLWPECFESDVKAMISTLKKLCGPCEVTDAMKADVTAIFKDARKFEIQLRRLKAVYSFRMCNSGPNRKKSTYGFYFDDSDMIDRSPCRSDRHGQVPAVDFIMSPGLHKRGNNDGDKYEDGIWLVKMGVVCDAARFFLKSTPSTTSRPVDEESSTALQSGEAKQNGEDQDIRMQHQVCTIEDEVRLGTPIPDSADVKVEEADSEQPPDPLSTPNLTSGSPVPNTRNTAQIQSKTEMNVRTRSRGPSNTDWKYQINKQPPPPHRSSEGPTW